MYRKIALALMLLATNAVMGGSVAFAQVAERAYAPEDLRSLSREDQRRVIRKEYSEQSGGRALPDDQLEFYLDQVNRSSWKFSAIKQDIARSLAGSGSPSSPPLATVTCSSGNYRYRECRTGFPDKAVLTQNMSQTRCVEGQNWGSGPGIVWVDKGCQGRFIAAREATAGVVCESRYGRYAECPTGFSGPVRLSRQLSSTRCIEGQNWGQRAGTVWVRNYCGAEFTRVSGVVNPDAGAPYTVTCSSDRTQNRTCVWERGRGVPEVIQQLTGVRCVQGRNWRYEEGRIWVSDGCGARFGAARKPVVEAAYEVECGSGSAATAWCRWDTQRGRPALVRDLSGRRCVEGKTWGYASARGIWVADGCRARFSTQR